jgi:hypothetical protein
MTHASVVFTSVSSKPLQNTSERNSKTFGARGRPRKGALSSSGTDMLAGHECDALLRAWGAFLRGEVEGEVGFPSESPSCASYESPEWHPPHPGPIRPGDVDRACWAMVVMQSRGRTRAIHNDLRSHYRDGLRIGYGRKVEGWSVFGKIWSEWSELDEPTNPK